MCDTKEQFAELSELEKQGTICLEGALNLTEPIQIDEITTDISRAILDKQYILVCCSATRQKEISSLIAPVLQNGQAIVFSPGNLGTLYLRQELEVLNQKRTESKRQTEIILAELSGNLWACRKAKGTVVVARPLGVQRIAACPASDLERAMEVFRPLFPLKPAQNIVEAVLNSPNMITHLAGTLLNVTEIEKKGEGFALFEDGLSESVIEIFKSLEQERNAVLSAYGLELYETEGCQPLMQELMRNNTDEKLLLFKSLKGPSSMKHRYITEDAPCGTALLISMARAAGIKVSIAESLLTLASTINKTDYYKCGRTLDSMGLLKNI